MIPIIFSYDLLLENGTIISKTMGTVEKSFIQYEVSADYPSDIFALSLEIFLNNGDIYTDWEFYIQHLDFDQYQ